MIVYVKHYLKPEGQKFFEQCWFPLVYALISQQEGFLSFKHERTENDCVFITLIFQDEYTFGRWVAYPGHDDLVNALDWYRSGDYWEVKNEGKWLRVDSKGTPKSEGLNCCEKIFGNFLEYKRKNSSPLSDRTLEELRSSTKNFGQHAGEPAPISFTNSKVPTRDGFHQVLLGGSFDLIQSTHDFDDYEKQDKIVSRKLLSHIATHYYSITDPHDPLFSPYYERDFNGFPPTTILCGEYDALRNDSEGYFQKLTAANIAAEKILLKGQSHDTIAMRNVLAEGPDPAEVIGNVIKKALRGGQNGPT